MEVYKTLKRRLSKESSSSVGSGSKDPSTRWVHPSGDLVNGFVEYSVKYIGETEVAAPKGSEVVQDAIHAINFKLSSCSVDVGLHSSVSPKPTKMDIRVNIHNVTIVNSKDKQIFLCHPLHRVSYCADDKKDKNIFAYIACNDQRKHICYLFLCNKNAEQLTLTIGQACDLAYQKYLEKKRAPVNEVETLQKRNGELTKENRELKMLIETLKVKYSIRPEDCVLPSGLPPTPVRAPPEVPKPIPDALAELLAAQTANLSNPHRNGDVPLVPPPRRTLPKGSNSGNPTAELDLSGPEVGRKLENLHIDKMDNVFDDDFDPRAHEKKDAENSKNAEAHAAVEEEQNIQEMLEKVDSRLTEIQGFAPRSFGDGRSINEDDEYATPRRSTASDI